MSTTAGRAGENEVTILARVFDDERGLLPRELARSILDVEFSERDKARMHDLAVRNQDDDLSPSEKEDLFAFAKAGTLLSILQSIKKRFLARLHPRVLHQNGGGDQRGVCRFVNEPRRQARDRLLKQKGCRPENPNIATQYREAC
jgi:hypothetical protein